MKRCTRVVALGAAATLLLVPAAAQAHVTLQPTEVAAGGFKRLDVRVPNERDDASTKKVQVQFPDGFIFISHEPVPGWTASVRMEKLSTPVEAFGEQHSEQVDTVTFSTDGKGIRPGQFQDFGLSLGLPDTPDTTLTFKAIQTYSSGEVVRWIGEPEGETPAPQVKLTASPDASGGQAHGAGDLEAPNEASELGGGAVEGDDGGGSETLAIIALIVGGLGLLAGGAGLAVARRARGGGAADAPRGATA